MCIASTQIRLNICTKSPQIQLILATLVPFTYAFWYALIELASYVFGACMLLLGHRHKIRFSYLVFGWLIIIVPALTGTFSSMPRYLLLAFPIYIILGTIKNKYMYLIYLMSGFSLLIIFLVNFSRGLWVA